MQEAGIWLTGNAIYLFCLISTYTPCNLQSFEDHYREHFLRLHQPLVCAFPLRKGLLGLKWLHRLQSEICEKFTVSE